MHSGSCICGYCVSVRRENERTLYEVVAEAKAQAWATRTSRNEQS